MKYRTGYKHQLAQPFQVMTKIIPPEQIDHEFFQILRFDGLATIYSGYAWDGASGGCPDNDYTLTPSLVHDMLYQAIRLGLLPPETRDAADRLFYTMCRERGLNVLIARFYLKMLHWFGGPSANAKHERPVLEAP